MALAQTVMVRAVGLLPVMYQTRQLAEELGITQQLMVQWVRLGASHTRDRSGKVWINGVVFGNCVDRQRQVPHFGRQARKERPPMSAIGPGERIRSKVRTNITKLPRVAARCRRRKIPSSCTGLPQDAT